MSTNPVQQNPVTAPGSTKPAATGPSSATGSNSIAPNESTFLTLLVAQMKNQDPLNPTDSTQFVGELAQFSSLEQLMGINQNVSAVAQVVAPNAATAGTSANAALNGTNASQAAALNNGVNTMLNSIG